MTPPLIIAALLAAPQDSADRWAPLASYLEERIAAYAFPGAVLAIGRRDTVLYLHAFGHLDDHRGAPTTTRTVYDIASLTKAVGLTTGLMMLVDEHKLDLDAPVTRYVPAFAAGGDSITVRMLLTHASGLPAWKPFFRQVHSRQGMFALVNAEPLEQPPGTRMAYSDLGPMVLTQALENVSGERIDRFLEQRLFRPLGMRDTRYRPPRRWLSRVAPTEHDPRGGRAGHGEVNDENAFAMGGISGHAGLFSTAPDLVKFAQFMLWGGRGRPDTAEVRTTMNAPAMRSVEPAPRLVSANTIAIFTRVQDPSFSSRALGWETPSEESGAGSRLGPHAYGHTGFTGTSVWIDPDQDLFVILLTNRHHPNPEVRRAVADLAVEIAGGRPRR